jgi:hypothetical protein
VLVEECLEQKHVSCVQQYAKSCSAERKKYFIYINQPAMKQLHVSLPFLAANIMDGFLLRREFIK